MRPSSETELRQSLADIATPQILVVGDLMLDVDVVQAVEADAFAVHAVSTVQEALELFTQRPAVEVLDLVRETLRRFRTLSAQR